MPFASLATVALTSVFTECLCVSHGSMKTGKKVAEPSALEALAEVGEAVKTKVRRMSNSFGNMLMGKAPEPTKEEDKDEIYQKALSFMNLFNGGNGDAPGADAADANDASAPDEHAPPAGGERPAVPPGVVPRKEGKLRRLSNSARSMLFGAAPTGSPTTLSSGPPPPNGMVRHNLEADRQEEEAIRANATPEKA